MIRYTPFPCFFAILANVATATTAINRREIVSSFNVVRTTLIDQYTTPLQVGNGNFAFNVDNTGMQTFLPFNTLSSWAWHNDNFPTDGKQLGDYTGVPRLTHGRNVSYEIPDPKLPEISQWLIGNPNRINLGRIGLKFKGSTLTAEEIKNPHQILDFWTGTITSKFDLDGHGVTVETQGNFESDAVAFSITSDLVNDGALQVEFDFPFPPTHTTKYKYEVFVGVYDFPRNHTTTITSNPDERDCAHIHHKLPATDYFVNLRWPSDSPLRLTHNEPEGSSSNKAHRHTLSPNFHDNIDLLSQHAQPNTISFAAHFSLTLTTPSTPSKIFHQNTLAWQSYWSEGGFIDLLTHSTNPNAAELQRRIILSQYHVRVNSAPTDQSPQESGLMDNGWYGKFHLEMVIWHTAHWVIWGRKKYFDNIYPALYERLLESSKERARKMGWEGAKWPKMTEIITGRSSPGEINGLLLWQQPQPMYLASLSYKASPTRETLEKWQPIVSATADHVASYAWKNETTGFYDIGPPAYGVTENTIPDQSLNLAYETAYFHYALHITISLHQNLSFPIPPQWRRVLTRLSPLPQTSDGLYAPYAELNTSWWTTNPKLTSDPRSLIMLTGILPSSYPNSPVNLTTALLTAEKVWSVWNDTQIRGWGRPVLAMNAARLGRPDIAVKYLTAYDYWKFDGAGFAIRGGDGGTPPPFMPGNAGLLMAVGFMVAGWPGSEGGDAPGFPKRDGWVVKHEGLMEGL